MRPLMERAMRGAHAILRRSRDLSSLLEGDGSQGLLADPPIRATGYERLPQYVPERRKRQIASNTRKVAYRLIGVNQLPYDLPWQSKLETLGRVRLDHAEVATPCK